MKPIDRLTVSSYGMNLADQIALVSVPLVAALAFGASPQIIGVLVACQSMAHLLGSLPFGLLVDKAQPKTVVVASTLLSIAGFALAVFGLMIESVPLFGLAITSAGFGIVLFGLVSLSILPKIAQADRLVDANARIAVPRAVASFVVPLAVGVLIGETPAEIFFIAATLGAVSALAFVVGLPAFTVESGSGQGAIRRIAEGGAYVLRHDLLLPISLCAVFWNLGFAALLVVMVPLVVDVFHAEAGVFGIAMSAFGLGAVGGSWAAGRFSRHIAPNMILLCGPGSSVVATGALVALPASAPVAVIYFAFFLLGFGPSMWLVTQNSVRQLVTPSNLLGRVNAVVQTAIYGIRPLGALLGGVVVGGVSPRMGLALVVICFGLSFAVALFSRLRSFRSYAIERAAQST